MHKVQRSQRKLNRPRAKVLPPRQPVLARVFWLGGDARHRAAAPRSGGLKEHRGARAERVRAQAASEHAQPSLPLETIPSRASPAPPRRRGGHADLRHGKS